MDACNLDTVCLGDFCSCGDIIINIPNLNIGTYTMFAKFNGVLIKREIEVVETDKIVIPNEFNENYSYLIKFMDSDNNIINDTWYSLNIMPCHH